MNFALGIDVGGTNIRIALVNENGEILKVIKEKTKARDINGLKEQILSLIERIDVKEKILGIGIGIPGPVKKDGTIIYIPNLKINESFNLKKMIEEATGIKTYVGNDANVAALAEAKVGAAKGYDVVQYITISTGIGGGLIYHGEIVTGSYGLAQEVGSMVINNGGRAPSIYKPKGCIEGEESGTSLHAKAVEAGLKIESSGDIFKLAANNNEIALKIKNEFISNMAAFIGSIVAYMEPDVFVLGGGVMNSKDYFLDELIKKVDDYVYDTLKGNVKILSAKYDQDCGIIGAAMQCF